MYIRCIITIDIRPRTEEYVRLLETEINFTNLVIMCYISKQTTLNPDKRI